MARYTRGRIRRGRIFTRRRPKIGRLLGGNLRRKISQKGSLHRNVTRSRGISGRQKRTIHRVIKRRR